MRNSKISIVGAGVMGEAMIKTLLKSGYKEEQICIVEKRPERVAQLKDRYGITHEGIDNCEICVLTVKPQDFSSTQIALENVENALVVSLMAGIRLEKIESSLSETNRVVRIMTNTPITMGEGMSVASIGSRATNEDSAWIGEVFRNSGEVLFIDENLMDSVTSISGSGPAYFFAFVEALTNAASSLGLSPQDSELLVRQTFVGSAKMLNERNESSTILKREVTSPGGTTEAALKVFEEMKFQEIIDSAVSAARARAAQLSDKY